MFNSDDLETMRLRITVAFILIFKLKIFFLQGAHATFIDIKLFYNDPCLKSHCIKQERGQMSSEVDLLVQSLTASIHSTHFDWYLLRCQVLFWAWERQQWTQTAGLHFPTSLAIRCGHVSKSPPGNVSSVLPSRAHRTWLVFPTKSRILTLLGHQNTVCALSNFNLFLPSLTGNQ